MKKKEEYIPNPFKGEIPDWQYCMEFGIAMMQMGRHKESAYYYTRSVELNPDFAMAYANRGTLYLTLGEAKAAIADFQRALALEPNNHMTHNSYASARRINNDPAGAVESCLKSIAINPEYSPAYLNCGHAYLELKKYEKAIEMFSQALLKGTPHAAEAFACRGKAKAALGDEVGAEQDRADAEKRSPGIVAKIKDR